MMLSGRLMEAFLALADTRHFAIAAQRCHVSASTFSQMIGRLEEQVGVRLFDRHTRKVDLTPEGEVFLRGASRMAAEMEAVLGELQGRSVGSLGRIALAAPPSLCAAWLPQQMATFRTAYPKVALSLHDAFSDPCLEMIASGDVDFGLNSQRGNDLEFDACLVFSERLFLLCRRDDPLASRQEVRLRDLAKRDFVHTSRVGSVWQQLYPVLTEIGVRDTDHRVLQLGSLAGLVANGFGVTIVPQLAVPLCAGPDLCALPIADKQAERPIWAVRRKHRSLSVIAARFWEQILTAPVLKDDPPAIGSGRARRRGASSR